LIDCQVHNEHLESLGAKLIRRDEFCGLLAKHVDDPSVSEWSFSIDVEAVTNFSMGIR
jgi:leucyl/phenylalanyl-tRNA--protein transferase